MKLLVYYEKFNFVQVTETEAYSVSFFHPKALFYNIRTNTKVLTFLLQLNTLLSDLGGSLGFYLGISVIATFEFIDLLFDLCLVARSKINAKYEISK